LSRSAARALFAYDWPLNVRELEQTLASAVVLARDGVIEVEHLPAPVRSARSALAALPDPAEAQAQRRDQLVELLRGKAGNVSAVARALGKTRAQIHRWIKRYALDPRRFRR
jgi:transcriptional regulator of acetoin/glycerol metabolism